MILILLALRCHFTGRFWDILRDLTEVGSFPESHGSPSANNNKRVYVPDEPADSPPDKASTSSPNGRGPILGSRRASSSLSPSNQCATSAVNGTDTFPPNSTTPPDTGDLSRARSVQTPGKAGGLEASGPSSTATLTRMFNGNTIPITTSDLGRLPLHYGVKFPTDFDFGAMADGWNISGSGRALTTLGGVGSGPGPSQGDGVNPRGTQAGVIPDLHPPQQQQQDDPFPWMPYTTTFEDGGTTTTSVPSPTTVATTTRPNAASTYVTAEPNQIKQTTDRLDSTISSFFGDVPSTSSTALGLTAGLLPVQPSGANEDLFDTLFQPSHLPVEMHTHPTAQTTQQPHDRREEQGYGSLPANAQGYLHGWSTAPQAFE